MEVLEAELWQLVDERLDEVRRLPYEQLIRRVARAPEVEVLDRPSGTFRRRTRVVACLNERLGIAVRVSVEGRRRPAEGGIVITSSGALAPEWSLHDEPPRGNPFAFEASSHGGRTAAVGRTAGLVLAACLIERTGCDRRAVRGKRGIIRTHTGCDFRSAAEQGDTDVGDRFAVGRRRAFASCAPRASPRDSAVA